MMARGDQHTTSSPSSGGTSHNRRAELDAAFDSDAEELPTITSPPSRPSHSQAPSDGPPGYDVATTSNPQDIFFDAGDALGDEPPPPPRQASRVNDPLGADEDEDDDDQNETTGLTSRTPNANQLHPLASSSTSQQQQHNNPSSSSSSAGGYDFERASYFTTSRSRSASSADANTSNANGTSSGPYPPYGQNSAASSSRIGLDSTSGNAAGSSMRATGLGPNASTNARVFAKARTMLGRFGRFVGMRVPGAAYSTLNQDDGSGNGSANRPRRVMGGGLGQDGVFGNLNAKPESRRRRARNGDPNDRGEDDDLVDDILPPTYEVAAADAAPGYWETTIAPGGMGWTPGGGHVGDVEDLILEGLPIGNFFGFAWNLLVSMCFQFVGFLLTYLLHTTHAARCGSRAGLGITLIQYGFYLRSRALQLEDGTGNGVGSGVDDGMSAGPHTLAWWGATIVYPGSPEPTSDLASPSARSPLWGPPPPPLPSSTDLFGAQPSSASLAAAAATSTASSSLPAATSTLASAFAANGDGLPADTTPMDGSLTDTSEWLSYALMVIGWFILLSSVLSYWRVHRWGRALVAASRREQESARAAENGGEAPETSESLTNPPLGFIHRIRAAIQLREQQRAAAAAGSRSTGTGEDWIIFPGMSAAGTSRTSQAAAAAATTSTTSGGDAGANSGHGLTFWGAGPRVGNLAYPIDDHRSRSNDVDDDDEDDDNERAQLTHARNGGSESHMSPEERRMIRGLRGAGLM
ncbi:unnamed protein product [Sympodiomycopsis kandeliae]